MVNTELLKGAYVSKGYTQKTLAKELNMTEKTFNNKLNNKYAFGSDEIEKLIVILDIKNPMPIFFSNAVT